MQYRRSDIIMWLRDLDRRADKLQLNQEQRSQAFLSEVVEKFPKATKGDINEALRAMDEEDEAERFEAEKRLSELDFMIKFFDRHKIDPDVPWIDAVRAVANRGDIEAAALLADLESSENALANALLEAAIDAHPGWSREGRYFVRNPDIDSPEDSVGLINWFQRTCPQEASAITSQLMRA